jgi:hypothetical protein
MDHLRPFWSATYVSWEYRGSFGPIEDGVHARREELKDDLKRCLPIVQQAFSTLQQVIVLARNP